MSLSCDGSGAGAIAGRTFAVGAIAEMELGIRAIAEIEGWQHKRYNNSFIQSKNTSNWKLGPGNVMSVLAGSTQTFLYPSRLSRVMALP